MTPKRRSVISLIFIINCISKINLIRMSKWVNKSKNERTDGTELNLIGIER